VVSPIPCAFAAATDTEYRVSSVSNVSGSVESIELLTDVMVQVRAEVRHEDVPVTAPSPVVYSLVIPIGSTTVIA
jgi:hypothetical protein